ncbi:MAG: WXG100 family type VII secretion target [Nocardioides sp.]
MTDAFSVDLDAVQATVEGLGRCADELDALLERLCVRMTALRGTWSGLAAVGQLEAQVAWERGFVEMREALRQMRMAGQVAHDNYAGAVDVNLTMWEQVR